MKGKINIILTGVGGQGVITAANILGKAALKEKVNVFVSEVHGMAQRGGSVNCSVRMGEVSGPLVPSGTADVILSTEPIEALRYIPYASIKTKIITDINPVVPFTVSVGLEKYPDLKADALHHNLLEKNSRVESRLRKARTKYNNVVRKYNYRTKKFPRSIVAKTHGFEPLEYLVFEERDIYKPKEIFDE